MLRHLFRLIWNRKRSNLLLLSEILLSFVVLFVVGSILINYGRNYFRAPGFVHANVWRLNLSAPPDQDGMPRPVLDEVLRQVRALPGVQALSLGSGNTPFRFISSGGSFDRGGREVRFASYHDADDDYLRTLGLHLREGRWFRASDDAAVRRPAVISQLMRTKLFGPQETAVGQTIRSKDANWEAGQATPTEYQVVGVVDDVRESGDLSSNEPGIWLRLVPHDTTHWQGAAVLVKVAPGQHVALQQRIVRTVAGTTRLWNTQVRTLADDRLDKLRATLGPLAALALVGLFLVLNVALGLFGVLWYNISQRRAEIGLRRALGATGAGIGRQFLLEVMLLTALGVAAGLLLAVQFPLLGVLDVEPAVYGWGMAGAAAFILLLAAACAWQPSRLAARVQPAVALRED